ncbi:MAG: SIR2 family protein [Chitinophagales bacterium]
MIEWDDFIDDIQEQKCVLLLGDALPNIAYENENILLHHAFAKYITTRLDKEQIFYKESHKNNLHYVFQQYLANNKRKRIRLESRMKKIYRQGSAAIPGIYQQLANLPFHLIINTSPDDFMFRALQKKKKKVQSVYYHFSKQEHEQNIGAFDAEKPLVYNLFGSLEDPSSTVLTAEDEVKFVHSLVSNANAVPNKIISHLKDVSLLFLGFNFEAWHFRMLLESLKIKPIDSFSPKHKNIDCGFLTQEFYKNKFAFEFLPQNTNEFIETLLQEMPDEQIVPKTKTDKKVMVVYADDDKSFYDKLKKALKPKTHLKLCSKADILGHQDYNVRLAQMINDADIILPLLSSDFWSDCQMEELLFQPHTDKKQIIPILTRPCDLEDATFYKNLPKLPSDNKAISISNEDLAYKNISKELEKLIKY